jgi:hypothetical protein
MPSQVIPDKPREDQLPSRKWHTCFTETVHRYGHLTDSRSEFDSAIGQQSAVELMGAPAEQGEPSQRLIRGHAERKPTDALWLHMAPQDWIALGLNVLGPVLMVVAIYLIRSEVKQVACRSPSSLQGLTHRHSSRRRRRLSVPSGEWESSDTRGPYGSGGSHRDAREAGQNSRLVCGQLAPQLASTTGKPGVANRLNPGETAPRTC